MAPAPSYAPEGAPLSYAALLTRLSAVRLMSMGAFHPKPDDGAPPGTGTLILLGPAEPGFWDRFTASPEFSDGAADPLDRWSTRIISAIAAEFGAQALFPFGGPPYQPFIAWAKRSGRAWQSPVTLLVHDTAGLMVSYRGALALRERLSLPLGPNRPCDTCSAPCLTACPAGALGGAGYDLDTCHRFLDTRHGSECLGKGCAVRRSCPISQSYGREPVQSAYHMGIFHR